jgi:catechol 2,3-dioxygenase-like lactoylglutathione lyase family enzyme
MTLPPPIGLKLQTYRRRSEMLKNGRVATRLPVRDLNKARAFYSDKLGLNPAEERPGGLLYRCGDSEFALFESAGTASGTHTQMGWTVDDIEATVADLRRRGLDFEEVEMPGISVTDGIAEIPGNYPSKGRAERAVWFKDLDGNVLGVAETVR